MKYPINTGIVIPVMFPGISPDDFRVEIDGENVALVWLNIAQWGPAPTPEAVVAFIAGPQWREYERDMKRAALDSQWIAHDDALFPATTRRLGDRGQLIESEQIAYTAATSALAQALSVALSALAEATTIEQIEAVALVWPPVEE